MKAVVLALVVLLCVDLVGYHGRNTHLFAAHLAGAGHEIGSWVYQP